MMKYIYVDNSKYPVTEVVFECKAGDILEADKKYEQEIGNNPAKQKGIAIIIGKHNEMF
jgi:hypothetical protein